MSRCASGSRKASVVSGVRKSSQRCPDSTLNSAISRSKYGSGMTPRTGASSILERRANRAEKDPRRSERAATDSGEIRRGFPERLCVARLTHRGWKRAGLGRHIAPFLRMPVEARVMDSGDDRSESTGVDRLPGRCPLALCQKRFCGSECLRRAILPSAGRGRRTVPRCGFMPSCQARTSAVRVVSSDQHGDSKDVPLPGFGFSAWGALTAGSFCDGFTVGNASHIGG